MRQNGPTIVRGKALTAGVPAYSQDVPPYTHFFRSPHSLFRCKPTGTAAVLFHTTVGPCSF